ncbi:MAG: CDGSH iron-sulfur domain-containing protein [Myxococcota bacterium]
MLDARVWIGHPDAAALVDLCNAIYNPMLRMIGAAYDELPEGTRGALVGESIGLMKVLAPLNEVLTRLPANEEHPGIHAGMSFAVTREIRVPPAGRALELLADRTRELGDGAARLERLDPALARVAEQLRAAADRLAALDYAAAPAPAPAAPPPVPRDAPPRVVVDGVEVVQGEDLELRFDTNRCIHARECVLGAPEVFVANVEGPWIHPDAMDTETLVAVGLRCPSGAITWTRKDGRPDEVPPQVNRLNVRENGPLAFRADLRIAGQAPRTRAVLCRCGKSRHKPFCDNSHKEAGFAATGEPTPTVSTEALPARDGVLNVNPTPDGPLLVSGNLELCTGTGATFAKQTRCALCRCGGSKNKPFCDGTHRTNGFRS